MKPGFPRYMISAQPFHNVCVGLWNNFDVGDNNYDQQQDKDNNDIWHKQFSFILLNSVVIRPQDAGVPALQSV